MTWSIEFLEELEKNMKKLNYSVQIQVLKGITKISKNPFLTKIRKILIISY